MPKSLCRLRLEVTSVAVEHLHDISDEACIREGRKDRTEFELLWKQLNGGESWDENPLVWVVGFKMIGDVMNKNLYEILGISEDATPDEIQAAYRQRAKEAHPDAGGNKEEFGLITLAKRTLINSESREHYDRTGQVEGQGSNIDKEAMETLSELIMEAFDADDPDPVKSIKVTIRKQQQKHDNNRANAKRRADRMLAKLERFKKKHAEKEESRGQVRLIEMNVHKRVKALRQEAELMTDHIELGDRMLRLIDNLDDVLDGAPHRSIHRGTSFVWSHGGWTA